MMGWWQIYLIVVFMALALGLALTPLFQKLAEKLKFYDKPLEQAHKSHQKVTPLLGGLAIFIAWLVTISLGICAARLIDHTHFSNIVTSNLPGMSAVSWKLFFICLGALVAVLVGLYDDCFSMSAKAKLLGQIAAAAIAVTWGGVRITVFFNDPVITWMISVFWYLLLFNAINFFDNMDGLAAGTAAIALSFFTIAAALSQQYFVAAIGAAAAGAVVGFWFYNHSPASIFMGDSGSHFLGYILATVSAGATFYNPEMALTRFPVLIPLFVLAIPLFDTAAVVVIRLYNHKPIYVGDNNHISHRFLHMGMTRRESVFLVHLLEIMIGLSVLPLMWGDEKTTAVSIIQACVILLFVSSIQYYVIMRKQVSDRH
ncbi:MAG: hypothetical protein A2020_00265 [Lentisphaerae bacterium GWF2_45_14]|nr:MAG: hypothetical protein A2020_00265 [Lentisphaerae bacterium GWF2_45_14]